jgi:hypothetical protein
MIEKGLDWAQGDQIALLPTAMQHYHIDYMTVDSYNAQTGEVTFAGATTNWYHWG